MDGLGVFVPEPRRIEAGGKTVAVAPLKVRQVPAFARAIGPALQSLAAGDLAAVLGTHGDALIEAVAAATGEPADWLGELAPDEFLRLAAEVVEVNADFFVRRVAPTLEALTARIDASLTGRTPSPSSPPAGSGSMPRST